MPDHYSYGNKWRESRLTDLVPDSVARAQWAWERRQAYKRMRRLGFSLSQIGVYNGRSGAFISQEIKRAEEQNESPMELYFRASDDIARLSRWNNKAMSQRELLQLFARLGT